MTDTHTLFSYYDRSSLSILGCWLLSSCGLHQNTERLIRFYSIRFAYGGSSFFFQLLMSGSSVLIHLVFWILWRDVLWGMTKRKFSKEWINYTKTGQRNSLSNDRALFVVSVLHVHYLNVEKEKLLVANLINNIVVINLGLHSTRRTMNARLIIASWHGNKN